MLQAEGRLTLAEGDVEYRMIAGDATKPVIVLLHEGLGCVAMWRDFPEQLAQMTGQGVFVFSRLGYGKSTGDLSDRACDYLHREALQRLPELLRIAGITRFVLYGHSDGASIALIYAGSGLLPKPQAVIVVAPHVFHEALCLQGVKVAAEAYRTTGLPDQLARYHGEKTDNVFWAWNDIWQSDPFWHWNIEMYLADITSPLLAIQGRDDPYGSLKQVETIVEQVNGAAELAILDDCQHNPFKEQTAATLRTSTDFLQRMTSTFE